MNHVDGQTPGSRAARKARAAIFLVCTVCLTSLPVSALPPAIEVDTFPGATLEIQLVGGPVGGMPQNFSLSGTATMNVYFEGASAGDATDDSTNGRDEVSTEIVVLSLTGDGLTATLNPGIPSVGEIEEQVNNTPGLLDLDPFAPGNADSVHDLFLEIDIGGGLVLHNATPLSASAVISEKPPRSASFPLQVPMPIELLNEDDNPSGVSLVSGTFALGSLGLVKRFAPPAVVVPTSSTLIFTLDNAANVNATAVQFMDVLPPGLAIATPADATHTCLAGTLTATEGTNVISFANGTVSAASSCTISVRIGTSTPGTFVNVTGILTSVFGDSGSAMATLVAAGEQPVPTTTAVGLLLIVVLLGGIGLVTLKADALRRQFRKP